MIHTLINLSTIKTNNEEFDIVFGIVDCTLLYFYCYIEHFTAHRLSMHFILTLRKVRAKPCMAT